MTSTARIDRWKDSRGGIVTWRNLRRTTSNDFNDGSMQDCKGDSVSFDESNKVNFQRVVLSEVAPHTRAK